MAHKGDMEQSNCTDTYDLLISIGFIPCNCKVIKAIVYSDQSESSIAASKLSAQNRSKDITPPPGDSQGATAMGTGDRRASIILC